MGHFETKPQALSSMQTSVSAALSDGACQNTLLLPGPTALLESVGFILEVMGLSSEGFQAGGEHD